MSSSIEGYHKKTKKQVDRALKALFQRTAGRNPIELYEAMKYVVLDGGKRLRPVLTLAVGEMLGMEQSDVMPAACAMELIHNSSLIYDDLPSMDNAEQRRGMLCVHIKYSPSTAILAANSLLVTAFGLLAESGERSNISNSDMGRVIEIVSDVVGADGMSGGQLMDLKISNPDPKMRQEINFRKTAKLFVASACIPSILASKGELEERALCEYGRLAGLVYQYVDDIRDHAIPRKGAGKSGLPRGYYEDKKMREKVEGLISEAQNGLSEFGERAARLLQFVDYLGGMT